MILNHFKVEKRHRAILIYTGLRDRQEIDGLHWPNVKFLLIKWQVSPPMKSGMEAEGNCRWACRENIQRFKVGDGRQTQDKQ